MLSQLADMQGGKRALVRRGGCPLILLQNKTAQTYTAGNRVEMSAHIAVRIPTCLKIPAKATFAFV